MKIAAIIILVLLGLYVLLGILRDKKLLLNKFTIFLAVVALGLLALSGGFSHTESDTRVVSSIQKKAPPVQLAPYMLQTSSRAYYVATFQDTPEYLILTDYFYYDRNQWLETAVPLMLDKVVYGNLEITKRNIGG